MHPLPTRQMGARFRGLAVVRISLRCCHIPAEALHLFCGHPADLLRIGDAPTLASLTKDLVYTTYRTSTDGTCQPGGDRVFVRDSPEDTGWVPSNLGGQPFWESPDIFLVPENSRVDVNAVASDSVITPEQPYAIWVRVNNDFGCGTVNNVKARVFLADPSALSVDWPAGDVTGGIYSGGAGHPDGISVERGSRALVGPFPWHSPPSGFGNGHKCLLAAIEAENQPAVSNPFDAPGSYQVAQRNVQISDCKYPLTNATTSDGSLFLVLTVTGATLPTNTASIFKVSFEDPNGLWYRTWLPSAGSDFTLAHDDGSGKTAVTLRKNIVNLLPPVFLGAGQSATAEAMPSLASGDPDSILRLSATLNDQAGATLVSNGGSCSAFQVIPQ